jgi:MFS family permease
MDNLGAVVGPLIALGLIAVIPLRVAIGLSVIPGRLAALAIVYAIRHTPRPTTRERTRLRFVFRPLLRGQLGRLLGAVSAFELGNIAATLLILRATQELTPSRGVQGATSIALVLYVGYNLAATVISIPAGRLSDRLGTAGPVRVMAGGVALFAFAYLTLIPGVDTWPMLLPGFLAAGTAIGCVETAEHAAVAALAPLDVRGSAFGLLAVVQSVGNLAASGIAGLLWTLASPSAAFGYATVLMLVALAALAPTLVSRARNA